MSESVEVEVGGDLTGVLLSFGSLRHKAGVPQSRGPGEPARTFKDGRQELGPGLHGEGLLQHLPVVEYLGGGEVAGSYC